MLSARNIDRGQVLFDDYRLISESAFVSENARTRIAAGDVLLTIVGTIGRTAVVPEGSQPFSLQRSVAVLTPAENLLPKFLCYQLQSPAIQKHFEANARGTAQKGVYLKTLGQTPVVLPPVEVQTEIVAEIEKQFSRLDEAVANLKRVKANLKRYKASVLKDAVEGRLVPLEAELARREGRDFETGEQLLQRILETRRTEWVSRGKYEEPSIVEVGGLTNLPNGWVWASAEQLSSFITKGTTPAANKLLDPPGDVQFLKVYNLTFDGTLNHTYKPAFVSRATHEGELLRSQVLAGDVLINIVGPPLGQVSVVPPAMTEANMNQAVARFRPIKPLSTKFVAHALMTQSIMAWAIRKAKTTAGQTNLTLDLCRRLPIPLPPLMEQDRIVAEVDRRLSLILVVQVEVDANLKRAQALRQATLQRAFQDRPASVQSS
ncbi:MAG: restriction endonuclease subunit S [Burkholderiaceae bacterium]